MRRRSLILLAAATPSLVATAGGAAQPTPSRTAGQYVDLAPIALPVVDGGRLRNYVFVTVRLLLDPKVDPIRMRDKEPYFRDALVRAAHRRPFTVPGDSMSIDVDNLKRTMLDLARAIAGPGVVIGVTLTNPPAAQHRLAPPKAGTS